MWVEVAPLDELAKRKRMVVEHDGQQILVFSHDGRVHALANICIHKQRELAKGVILRGKLVCPGHQWAFDVETGWEAVKQQCQPSFPVKVDDGTVYVDPAECRTFDATGTPDRPEVLERP